jgi:xanthine dehydrogenase accessory factor
MALRLADIYEELARMHREGISGVVATVVRADGSTPRNAGAKMIVYADGRILGSVGGGTIESTVIDAARGMVGSKESKLFSYDLADGQDMTCGGGMEVFLEPIASGPMLVVIGGGHVGLAVARAAKQSGFSVAVADDRADMVSAKRFPFADLRLVGNEDLLESDLKVDGETFVVVVTRGHRFDKEWVSKLLVRKPAYLGMLGSETKVAAAFAELEAEGTPRADLDTVHAPIGLDIGAETPDEIAVSVVAEIIAAKNGIRDTARLMDKIGFKGRNRD